MAPSRLRASSRGRDSEGAKRQMNIKWAMIESSYVARAQDHPSLPFHFSVVPFSKFEIFIMLQAFILLLFVCQVSRASPANYTNSRCRVLPGDYDWPSIAQWDKLNNTIVGGKLILNVPLGSPCHDPTYNAAQCAAIRQGWDFADIQYAHSHGLLICILTAVMQR